MLTRVNTEIAKTSKKRGRPPGRSGRPYQMRVTPEFDAMIDEWRRKQPELPSRAEAIRRLVEQALKGCK
jgi:hypothetical protein